MYFEDPDQALNNIYRYISRGNDKMAEDYLRKLIEDPEYDIQYLRNAAKKDKLSKACIDILFGNSNG